MKKPDEAHSKFENEKIIPRPNTRRKNAVINFRRYAERLLELDELYLKIQMVSGYTVEQLLEMFMEGCTIQPPPKPAPLDQICNEKT